MIGIITGDIVNSRTAKDNAVWLEQLKWVLTLYGKSPKTWEIFRGDSFQAEIVNPRNLLLTAITIKAAVKSIEGLDVRMGLGIGEKNYTGKKITESNGSAFIYSGEVFESLKKSKLTMRIKSLWPDFDETINIMLELACCIMDSWTGSSAEFVKTAITEKNTLQQELVKKLKIKQSSISERKKRAKFTEIMNLEDYFRKSLSLQIKN